MFLMGISWKSSMVKVIQKLNEELNKKKIKEHTENWTGDSYCQPV